MGTQGPGVSPRQAGVAAALAGQRGGDVALGVPGRGQHERHRDHGAGMAVHQRAHRVAQRGRGQLDEAARHARAVSGGQLADPPGQRGEGVDPRLVTGAVRGEQGIGSLRFPFAFVILVLMIGFGAALALPATEGPLSRLWLGLPLRAAFVIYGVGLLPIIVLPVAYAMTFETLTLSSEDVDRVRAVARQHKSTESAANQLEA